MPLRIFYYTASESDLVPLSQAVRLVSERLPGVLEVRARSKRNFVGDHDEEPLSLAKWADAVIMHLMGGSNSLPQFNSVVDIVRTRGTFLQAQPTAVEETTELRALSTLKNTDYDQLKMYIDYGGVTNFTNLLLWLLKRLTGLSVDPAPPQPLPWEGLYHPSFPAGTSLEEYKAARFIEGRPTIGILFYQSHWLAGNLLFIDHLISALENRGANVLPVFLYATKDAELGSRGIAWVLDNYFRSAGKAVVDIVISTLMFSQLTSWEGKQDNFYLRLGVPVIKAILALGERAEWENSLQGLGPLDVALNIALPEFDGALITFPMATREKVGIDPTTGAMLFQYVPLKDRVEKLSRLAYNWARLRHIPNNEKRVAIIFHNYPPRNDRLGTAFGLDSAASVYNLLKRMSEAGFRLDELPADGEELIHRLLEKLTNDRRWVSPEQMAGRAVGKIGRKQYRDWFEKFPLVVQERLRAEWGEPPGELFNWRDELLVPGLINGNIFIGLQPPRGYLDDPSKIYHSPDVPPPHHYLAYYRWLRDVFKADAVIHIGKHGSLEWLPGKGVGLSGNCYPDVAISDLPNIYPYIINNPGEGTQAKRRSYACIIDHLVPVMTEADSYDELAEIESLLKEYYQARSLDASKMSYLEGLIWEKVEKANLQRDLGIDQATATQDFGAFAENLHSYLNELADTQIREGLHILGEAPTGQALVEMLVALTRLPNGSIPSLREVLAALNGLNYNSLLENRGHFDPTRGLTHGELLRELTNVARQLITELGAEGYDGTKIRQVAYRVLGKSSPELEQVLEYIALKLKPALAGTAAELDNALSALAGNYVPPGPSGAPTRGMADILPTGRNFFSVDPLAIPSRSSWRVGVLLAQSLIDRFLKEEGRYPENVGMIAFATSNMRTGGDDVAEALYLLGVRPIWEERNGRVRGLEVIPLSELRRPRLDVTLRISGMFRDAFPSAVELLDKAVEMVALLDESDEDNFVAKHYRLEVKNRLAAGERLDEAREKALWRIFSDRPGAYGAGVSDLIDARNWRNEHDLAEVYLTWGGWAYSRRSFGREAKEVFRQRLGALDLTVKNEDSRELDMLDSDDFYSYHGGMIASVKAIKGSLPLSFTADSSDPERVKTRTTAEETKHIFRSRILNPKWIASMQRHGYKGASDLSRMIDIAFGWDATAEVLEDWMYNALAEKYVFDQKMQEWFKEFNPWALQNISERLLEAIARGMWQASDEIRRALQEIYLSVEGELEGYSE